MLSGFQPFASSRLDHLDQLAGFNRFGRTAVASLLDGGTQCFKLCLAALLALFHQTQTFTHDFAGGGIAAAINEILDELLS